MPQQPHSDGSTPVTAAGGSWIPEMLRKSRLLALGIYGYCICNMELAARSHLIETIPQARGTTARGHDW